MLKSLTYKTDEEVYFAHENSNWINHIMVFLLVYVSNDTLLFGTNANRMFFRIHIVILLTVFFILFVKVRAVSKRVLCYATVWLIFSEITHLLTSDQEITKYIYNCFLILLSVLCVTTIKKKDFIIIYNKVLYMLSLASIIVYNVSSLNLQFSTIPYITNTVDYRFQFWIFSLTKENNQEELIRNYCIFREPGVAACFILLAMLFELFFVEKISIKRIIVYVVAMLLTFSTGGYVATIILFFVWLMDKMFRPKNRYKKHAFVVAILIVTIILIVLSYVGLEYAFDIVFKKLFIVNDSRNSRFGAIEGNLRMYIRSPFYGNGWSFVEDNFDKFAFEGLYQSEHNTNTLLKYLAIYGIAPFLIEGILLTMFFCKTSKSKLIGICLMLTWVIALSNEDLCNNVIMYILPLYGLSQKMSNREDKVICVAPNK